jgi:hypothetical protein
MTGDEHQEELNLGLPATGTAADPTAAGVPSGGLSWTWELDLEALLDAVTGPVPWSRDLAGPRTQPVSVSPDTPGPPAATDAAADVSTTTDADEAAAGPADAVQLPDQADADQADADQADADLAEYLDAVEAGRSQILPLPVVAGRVAELIPAGPGLAGWLGAGPPAALEDGALAGIAASCRRLASWAQAAELAAVAELASRSAAADDQVGADEHGRPAKVTRDACAEVSLALTMSQAAATWWTDLAVTLRWRLTATGTALATGEIDLGRARAIADATACLDDDTARLVQDKVLAKAGTQTTAQLRAALRRAVITADPHGADRRREEAEKRARVMLYPDDDGTASLGGYSLPGISATAAMARISALAKALQATGAGGGIDLLRGHVFLGLLLGTLPYIPPAPGAPPDQAPPDDDDGQPGDGPAGSGRPGDQPPGDQPPGDEPPGDEPPDGSLPGEDPPAGGSARRRASAGCPGREDHCSRRTDRDGQAAGHGSQARDRDLPPAGEDGRPAEPDAQRGGHSSRSDDANGQPQDRDCHRAERDAPHPGPDRPPDPRPGRNRHRHDEAADDDDDPAWARPPPAWPPVPALLQPGPAAMNHLTPATSAGKLLDLRLPWVTLTGESPQPGHLGRLGPITPDQARHLADLATADPSTQWRIIITDPDGHAAATTSLTRPGGTHRQAGLIRQVTVTIGPDSLTELQMPGGLSPVLNRVQAAARTAAAAAASKAARDHQAPDGCAHTDATTSYQPTTRLRDYITARDLTCRFPTCRQPIWRCDLDHTTPFDQGGRTCSCNLGGLCRFHHQLKGQASWHLQQATPGTFTWTTPTGRRYTTQPGNHAA